MKFQEHKETYNRRYDCHLGFITVSLYFFSKLFFLDSLLFTPAMTDISGSNNAEKYKTVVIF